MPLYLTRDRREGSTSSLESSGSRSSMSSLGFWYRKHKRNSSSPSPSPLLRRGSLTSEGFSTDSSRASTRSGDYGVNDFHLSQHSQQISTAGQPFLAQDRLVINPQQSVQQHKPTLPTDQIQGLDQLEQIISNSRPIWSGRGRSSVRLLEILPSQDFAAKELAKPIRLSQPSCPFFVGRVYQPHPEPGLRVETKARSRESCFTTTRPLYSARSHSPLVTGKPYTIYFEGEIRLGNSEDSICLALGFVAGRDRASLMPGFERGSIGIHYRDGGLYVNQKLLARVVFKPGQQIGIGMTFCRRDFTAQEAGDAQSSAVSSSIIHVKVFLSQDEKKAGSWNLDDLREGGSLLFEGLEGHHDLYAAVGTLKEVNVDILFDKRDWRYDPEAG